MYDYQVAPLDLRAKLLTVFVIGLLLVIGRENATLLLFLISLILLATAVLGIRGYSLTDEELHIRHIGWSQHWSLRDLRDVKIRPGVLTGSMRTLGIGGFFGYIGRFHSQLLGSYQAYV
ncbi:MAG: PH domain-containing protein, partial [Candidatus Promineifilaceae bacterium]